jgi:NAD(P)-dependent dehydrogenase (short-subunit alcohol dehydrogenase family)
MLTVVITGVSTGIGRGTADVLLEHGFRVFGSVRKAADAERLTRELGPNFSALVFDVTDEAGVARAAAKVAAALNGATLSGLVNNAGIAVPGPLLELAIGDFRRQLEVNLTGQLIVTQVFAPLLGTDGSRSGDPGRIVMMSSVGGRSGSPFVGAYNTSKFGLEGLSESLRRELMIFGIDVIVVAPGAVATPIWDKADAVDFSRLDLTPYAASLKTVKDLMIAQGKAGFPAERIGRAVLTALTARRPRTRYTVTPEPFMYAMGQILPKRFLDRAIAKRLGISRQRR